MNPPEQALPLPPVKELSTLQKIQASLSPEERIALAEVLARKPIYVEGAHIIKDEHPFAQGSYGAVFKAADNSTSYAVKMAHNFPKAKEALHRELAVMQRFSGNAPYVIQLSGIYFSGSHLGILMPLMSGGALCDFLDSHPGPSLSGYDRLELALQITLGIISFHEAKWVHRDLKAANVLIHVHGVFRHAVISDFGSARPLVDGCYKETYNRAVTTYSYCPPSELKKDIFCKREETTQEFHYDPLSDTFAFAFILYYLLTGNPHAAETNYSEAYTKIKNTIQSNEAAIIRLKRSQSLSEKVAERRRLDDAIADLEKQNNDAKTALKGLSSDPQTIEGLYISRFPENRIRDRAAIQLNRALAPALAAAIEMSWGETDAERKPLEDIREMIISGLHAQAPKPRTSASTPSLGHT